MSEGTESTSDSVPTGGPATGDDSTSGDGTATTDAGASTGDPTTGEPETCVWQDLWTGEPVPPLFSSTKPHFTLTDPEPADLDGDGDIDLIAADLVADELELWRNDGAGALELAGTLPAGYGPDMAATVLVPDGDYRIQTRASDLDGDGDLDLVVGGAYMPCGALHCATGYWRVLLNDGAWQFSATSPVASGTHDLEIGDMDGDGTPDLVLPGDPLTIALGDGAGGFAAPVDGTVLTYEISLGDLDDDGDLDALIRGAGIHVGLNKGGVLSFTPVMGAPPDFLNLLGDLDGDGDLDAASIDYVGPNTPRTVYLLLNDGAGLFTPMSTGIGLWGFYNSGLHAADLDGDGDLEITVVTMADRNVSATEGTYPTASHGVHVLRNDGAGTFAHHKHQFAPWVAAVGIADFDGDAAPDLALTGGRPADGPSGVRIALNTGQGFGRRSWPVGRAPEETVAVDIDGDGDDDLLTANSRSGDATLLVNDGGDLSRQVSLAPVTINLPLVEKTESVEPADFDGDGLIDLAVASDESHGVWLFRNLGDLEYAQIEGVELTLPDPLDFWPEGLAAGDLDGDGDQDLVAAGGSLHVFENLGDATFALAVQLHVGSGADSVVAVDVDGDGALDLVGAAEGDYQLGVVRNTGGLTFGPTEPYAVGGEPDALAAGDLDGDGRPELVAALREVPDGGMDVTGQAIAVLWNNGRGGYGLPTMIPVGLEPRGVAIGDGDGDGDLDVLAAAAVSGSVAVLINDGGALTVERTLPVGPHPMGVVFARLDATCGLEIAASAKYADDIFIIPSR